MDIAVLADFLHEQDRLQEAEPLFEEALAIFRRRLPSDHPVVAMPLLGLGRIYMRRGAHAAALPLLDESVRLRIGGFGPDYWGTAQAQSALGACLAALERFEEAEPVLTRAYELLRADRGDGSEHSERARRRLVGLYEAWDKPELAATVRTGVD